MKSFSIAVIYAIGFLVWFGYLFGPRLYRDIYHWKRPDRKIKTMEELIEETRTEMNRYRERYKDSEW